MNVKHRRQSGFSLIELLLVIALIAILLISVLSRKNTAQTQTEVSEELQNLTTLTACIENIFQVSPNYTGLSNTIMVNNGCVPRKMQGSGTNIRHSWNSGAAVSLGTASGNEQYTISYTQVPQNACNLLVSQTFNGYASVTVNGTAVNSVASASAACGNSNTIVWIGG